MDNIVSIGSINNELTILFSHNYVERHGVNTGFLDRTVCVDEPCLLYSGNILIA
jgi:hypothetical protein